MPGLFQKGGGGLIKPPEPPLATGLNDYFFQLEKGKTKDKSSSVPYDLNQKLKVIIKYSVRNIDHLLIINLPWPQRPVIHTNGSNKQVAIVTIPQTMLTECTFSS